MPIAKESLQSLLLQLQFDGTDLSTATGFVVRKGAKAFLITNRHVVTGRRQDNNTPLSNTGGIPNSLVVWHNRAGRLGEWVAQTEPLLIGTTPRWVEHPSLTNSADLVALPLTQLQDVELYPYDLENPGADIAVGVTDVVSVVGFPFGMTGGGRLAIWATGFIASEPDIDFDNKPAFLIDCRSRQGQSGSPVNAYRGVGVVGMRDGSSSVFGTPVSRLLGIYSGRINEQSDLGIVWKISAVSDLIRSIP
jgi:S1-C subfamily serine protease